MPILVTDFAHMLDVHMHVYNYLYKICDLIDLFHGQAKFKENHILLFNTSLWYGNITIVTLNHIALTRDLSALGIWFNQGTQKCLKW